MLKSACASTLCVISALFLVAAQRPAPAPTDAVILTSLSDLNAAVVSASLLLVLFDPFSQKGSGATSASSDTECSTDCQKLLSLCEGAAALPLPQRSRIACGHARGGREWMKMWVFLPYQCRLLAIAAFLTCHQVFLTCSSIIIASSVASVVCWHFQECLPCTRRVFLSQ
jgi:hypothetical protein